LSGWTRKTKSQIGKLTARASEAKELLVRVGNLIGIRRALQEKSRENIVLQPADTAIASIDAQFLKRLMESIERHMAEPDCNTDTLARDPERPGREWPVWSIDIRIFSSDKTPL